MTSMIDFQSTNVAAGFQRQRLCGFIQQNHNHVRKRKSRRARLADFTGRLWRDIAGHLDDLDVVLADPGIDFLFQQSCVAFDALEYLDLLHIDAFPFEAK